MKILLFILLVWSCRLNADEYLKNPLTDGYFNYTRYTECQKIAEADEKRGLHKWKGVAYKPGGVCGMKGKEQTTYGKTIGVLVFNSDKASIEDLKMLERQYKEQMIEDYCPNVSVASWKWIDELQFLVYDAEEKPIGFFKITKKECKISKK